MSVACVADQELVLECGPEKPCRRVCSSLKAWRALQTQARFPEREVLAVVVVVLVGEAEKRWREEQVVEWAHW